MTQRPVPARSITCRQCNGSGWCQVCLGGEQQATCSACHASGRCTLCGGTGKETRRQPAA